MLCQYHITFPWRHALPVPFPSAEEKTAKHALNVANFASRVPPLLFYRRRIQAENVYTHKELMQCNSVTSITTSIVRVGSHYKRVVTD
jgi:hypothetical protein